MEDLTDQTCEPCEGGVEPMSSDEAEEYLENLNGWTLLDEVSPPRIRRIYELADFVTAVDFVNELADIAEEQGHHPTITIDYDTVTVTIWTHAIDGLSENDFILAAHYDEAADSYT